MTDGMSRRAPWGEIVLGVSALVLLTFSNGRFSHPVAAWCAPLLFVRFIRDLPLARALALAYAVSWVSCTIQWAQVFPMSGPLFAVVSLLLCLVPFAPYCADRLLAPRLGGFAGTLVLPTSMVVAGFLFARLSPYGTWGSLAYSQAPALPLMQIAAVTGTSGVTFVIAWVASALNLALEDRRARRALHVPTFALVVATVVAVLGYGVVRLTAPASTAHPVTVAMISPRTDDDASYWIARAGEVQEALLGASREAVRAGATLVAWPEGSFSIFARDEPAWLARAAAFARDQAIFLAAPYATRVSEADPSFHNTMVLVGPDGTLLWHYRKSRPVPGLEDLAIPGDGVVARAAAHGVRLAGMICFDADHLDLMRQVAGTTDLLLVPSDDWAEIVDLHAAMVRVRAIESGVPIVRSTQHGISVAFDRFGRVLGSHSDAGATGRVLAVNVVPGGALTVYGRFGDWLSWLSIIALVGLAAAAIRARGDRDAPT